MGRGGRWEPSGLYTRTMGKQKLLWILEEVRSRRLGFGKAAELSGLPLAQFLLLMGKHQISPFDYDEDELAREIVIADSGPSFISA